MEVALLRLEEKSLNLWGPSEEMVVEEGLFFFKLTKI